MFIDTHCHIEKKYYDDIDSLILKIKNAGIDKIIVNGCDINSNMEVLELVKKYDIVYGAIGLQPTELSRNIDDDLQFIERHICDDKIVALGEIGLDKHYDDTDFSKQLYAFRKQLDLAKKYNKPIIVHSRDCIQDTYNILKEYNLKGSIHCYSGSLEMAREFTKLGYVLGIGGVCTYSNSTNIRNVIKNIDLEYIVLETDAPYLTPEPKRGEKNSSVNIPLIANKIADIKDIDVDDVSKATGDTARRIFDF